MSRGAASMACSLKTASRFCATNDSVVSEDLTPKGSLISFVCCISFHSDSHLKSRGSSFSVSGFTRRRRGEGGFLLSRFMAVRPYFECHGTRFHTLHHVKDKRYRKLLDIKIGTADWTRRDNVHTTVIGCYRPAFPRQSTISDTAMVCASNNIFLNGMVGDSLADLTCEKPFMLQGANVPSGKPLHVAVDVDEVLGSFLATLNIFIAERYFLRHNLSEYHVYDFMQIWNCSQIEANQRVHAFFESEHFKDGIFPIPGAYQSLLRLAEYCNLIVITSRQHIIRKPTMDWIEQHFPGIFEEVHFGNHFALHGQARPKSEICRSMGVDILIDDNPRYAVECAEHGIEVLLFDFKESYPWSRTPDGPVHPLITRVRDWMEVELALHARSRSRFS
ncbi:hypothetical protein O6H91_10G104000 [Diphasiastrum complanatum]|uniref:Uncharacterized protein n=1 Tax=Diphasiastrum complanatum TaxID=34168 RepID=A0ACC2CK69_DIPCM|nr:hypothetical protein O6H91_Y300500 [Diphasiastrum complanatum]KAJ7289977.1 hypothetical protein O6H91_Y300500 [Diphasiastrum complanatum]KAJ7542389.1 hypothetical protein O6H91_10G104000 [Diphasiastrum complanatum]